MCWSHFEGLLFPKFPIGYVHSPIYIYILVPSVSTGYVQRFLGLWATSRWPGAVKTRPVLLKLLHPLKTSHIYCKFQNICWTWYIFLLRSGTKVKEVLSVNKPIEEDSEDDLKDNMWLEMRRINN